MLFFIITHNWNFRFFFLPLHISLDWSLSLSLILTCMYIYLPQRLCKRCPRLLPPPQHTNTTWGITRFRYHGTLYAGQLAGLPIIATHLALAGSLGAGRGTRQRCNMARWTITRFVDRMATMLTIRLHNLGGGCVQSYDRCRAAGGRRKKANAVVERRGVYVCVCVCGLVNGRIFNKHEKHTKSGWLFLTRCISKWVDLLWMCMRWVGR